MKKITSILALMLILCLYLSACRQAGSGGAESTAEPAADTTAAIETTSAAVVEETAAESEEEIQLPDGENQETFTQVTMPDVEMPDQHEGDYELPPGEDPEVTVGDK